MRDPDQFDHFYKDVRTRLLVLTYCLTGDLPSSRAAVRDAFVATCHRWRKVSRLPDPEAWTRARACRKAQRRHTAKLWHREKGLDPEVKATLDALGKLSFTQRRVLLLSELTLGSLSDVANEVGLSLTDAQRTLQAAATKFAERRGVPPTVIHTLLEGVAEHVESQQWPRATIIRRAGGRRRRTHTVIGAVATVAALVVTGTLVTDAAGVRPTLTGERVQADGGGSDSGSGSADQPETKSVDLPENTLVNAAQVDRALPETTWEITRTDDNTYGDGIVMTCQESRYADSHSTAALVRTFAPKAPKRAAKKKHAPAPTVTAVQATQSSATPRAASRSFDTAVGWFAGCTDDRAQLIATRAVRGVGDEAMLVVLRTWDKPSATVVVGVARTGLITTTTFARISGVVKPALLPAARLLGAAVSGLCTQPDGGACTSKPRLQETGPVPVSAIPGMLGEVDLPPVSGVERAWVGTEPRKALQNAAATRCDNADFRSRPIKNNVTRTFLIPGAKLPDQFGLTETVGSLPAAKAKAFVAQVRKKLSTCSDRQMGTDVSLVRHTSSKRDDLSVWHVTTEITDNLSVSYLMGIVRHDNAVAQVGFVPAPKVGMAPGAFEALVERARVRLASM